MMKVKFVGATEGVTGSCSLLWHTATDTQILIDCGMHQGPHELEWLNRSKFSDFNPEEIQYVILTHAHIDHCGLLPKLVKEGFRGWVYCTEATGDIAKEMLLDSAKVSGLYSPENVEGIDWHFIDKDQFSWSHIFRLNEGVSVTFNRGSHVLGGCSVSIAWAKRQGDDQRDFENIHFTGDIGCQSDDNPYLPLLKPDHKPYPTTSYIVTEATYGDRAREPHHWEQRVERLSEIITRTVHEKKGKVLIPTFAFHRMQELIADLCTAGNSFQNDLDQPSGSGGGTRVLCHSPLGQRVNAIYASQLGKTLKNGKRQYLNPDLSARTGASETEIIQIYANLAENGRTKFGGIVLFTPTKGKVGGSNGQWTSNLNTADVVLASSGMCDKGPSEHYLGLMSNDPKNTIIITGFQSAGSAGRGLLESAESRSGAEVIDMSSYYSGHADQRLLLEHLLATGTYSHQSRGATVFINHGTPEGKEALKNRLIEPRPDSGSRTIDNVHIASSSWFNLDAGEYLPDEPEHSTDSLEEENRRLRKLLMEAGVES